MPKKARAKGKAKAKSKAKAMAKAIDVAVQLFRAADTDGSGDLSREELTWVMRKLDSSFDEAKCNIMFAAFDTNKDGKLQFEEFLGWLNNEGPYADAIDQSLNEGKKDWHSSVEVKKNDINTGKGNTYTFQCAKSQYKQAIVWLADLTDPKLALAKKIHPDMCECGVYKLGVVVMDKAVPIDGTRLNLFNLLIECVEFVAIVRPEDRSKIEKEIIPSLVECPELLSGALETHLIMDPRLHFADVVFTPPEAVKHSVLSAATFGSFDGRALVASGKDSAADISRFHQHHYMGRGMESGEMHYLRAEGKLPRFRTVMNCSGSKASFALIIGDVLGAVAIGDSSGEKDGALSNFEGLQLEYKRYVSMPDPSGSDEEEEEE